MNVYEKLQKARFELAKMDLPKSGFNKFGNFKYYELQDICPAIDNICNDLKLCYVTVFEQTEAKMKIINCEKPEEQIEFSTPLAWAELKGGQRITNIGATHTFCRRYLFLLAFNITEGDVLDALSAEDREAPKPKKVTTKKEVKNDADEKNKLIEKIKANAQNESIKRAIMGAITRENAKSFNDLSLESLKEIAKEL